MTKTYPRQKITVNRLGFWTISVLLLIGCAPEPLSEEARETPYFDLPALVKRQVQWLDSLNPPVVIKASISGQDETEALQKDSAAWSETLALFRQADINRPVLQGQYESTDSVLTDQSLRLRTYRSRRADQAEIPYLKVYYRDTITNVYRVETAFQEDNLLYSTYRRMWMDFAPYQGEPRLTAFETVGKQKMILRDSVTYVAHGEIQSE